jgi:hypothetical protein
MPHQAWRISTGRMMGKAELDGAPHLGFGGRSLSDRLISCKPVSGEREAARKRSRITSVLSDHPRVDSSWVLRHSTAQLV